MKEITDYTIDELKDIIENKSDAFNKEELNHVKKQYNTLLAQVGDSYKLLSKKDLLKELANNNFCEKTKLTPEQVAKLKGKPDIYIEKNMYLCKLDDTTNTRILLGIYKSINFIQNIIIASIICTIIAIIIGIII